MPGVTLADSRPDDGRARAGLLAALDAFHASDADRAIVLRGLVDALRPRDYRDAAAATAHLDLLSEMLENDPTAREAVATAIADVFARRGQTGFLTRAGILPGTGFFSELWRRTWLRLLPMPTDTGRVDGALATIFHRRSDYAWLYDIPVQTRRRFWRAVQGAGRSVAGTTHQMQMSMVDAVRLLALRAAVMGVDPELQRVGDDEMRAEGPFLLLPTQAETFALSCRACLEQAAGDRAIAHRPLLATVARCRRAVRQARANAAREGTSLRLTYLMVMLEQTLRRLSLIVRLLADAGNRGPEAEAGLREAWTALFRDGVRGVIRRDSIREHFREVVGLLALRVTENAAQTGEHYITHTRQDYMRMWRAAAGGGIVIGAMALLKIFAARLELAPLNQAFVFSANYAIGFMLVHMLHFTIATKQPAMTAATLAASISEARGHLTHLGRVVELITRTLRSQIAAIAGNVMVALPVALGLGFGLSWLHGAPVVSPAKAEHLLHELDPLRSLALFHAAIAGVFLFLSGLIAGDVDNLCRYRRIPQRVASLRWLRRIVGAQRAQRFGDYVERNLGGLASNLVFGIFLGVTGTIGLLFGLPLDIRHVAFSAANLGYALVGLNFEIALPVLLRSVAGVMLIGAVNLTVSFALALWVALRSRGVEFIHTRQLLVLLARRVARHPWEFLLPPRVARERA